MITVRKSRSAATAGTMMSLIGLILSACVSQQAYNALEADYNQLNQQLSGEVAQQQVRITRLQGAIKVAVNSDLLFPSGSWQMPPQAAQLIARMGPDHRTIPADKDHRDRLHRQCSGRPGAARARGRQ